MSNWAVITGPIGSASSGRPSLAWAVWAWAGQLGFVRPTPGLNLQSGVSPHQLGQSVRLSFSLGQLAHNWVCLSNNNCQCPPGSLVNNNGSGSVTVSWVTQLANNNGPSGLVIITTIIHNWAGSAWVPITGWARHVHWVQLPTMAVRLGHWVTITVNNHQ